MMVRLTKWIRPPGNSARPQSRAIAVNGRSHIFPGPVRRMAQRSILASAALLPTACLRRRNFASSTQPHGNRPDACRRAFPFGAPSPASMARTSTPLPPHNIAFWSLLRARFPRSGLSALGTPRRLRSLRHSSPRKRSEGETSPDRRSKVVVIVIGDTGTMRNGDGQTAGHVGIRNSGKTVETLGEVMIHIERLLVKGARAGTAETGFG